MTKARILKHTGNLEKAAEMMDFARTLDLKDRYINSKATKYHLRNNQSERALKTIGLFTRADTVGGPLADLLDMQCIWYLTEDGESYSRQGNVGLALKRLHAVANIFDVWQEDQFDFHNFSLRKGQIRAYIDMVRWEDHAYDHPFYTRAALDAIAIYLNMADKTAASKANGETEADEEEALALKKAAKKAKKEQQRLEREAAEKQAKQDPNKITADGEPAKKDEDPLGLTLAATTEPLTMAMKLLTPMLQASPKCIEAQLAGFEVFMRRRKYNLNIEKDKNLITNNYTHRKYLLALRCLNAATALDPNHPKLHAQIVEFAQTTKSSSELPPKVMDVLKSEFKSVDLSADLAKYNAEFESRHKDSALHILSAVSAKRLLGKNKSEVDKQLLDVLDLPSTTFVDAAEVLSTLRGWKSTEVSAFQKAAQSKWPEATRLG